MSKSTFPIVEVQGNRLISTDGNVGHFYELKCSDLSQMTPFEKERYFDSLSMSLNNLDEMAYFKFYSLSGRSFLETNSTRSPEIAGIELVESEMHLESFFGDIELYSGIGIFDDYLNINGEYLKIMSVKQFSEDPIDESLLPIDVDYILMMKPQEKQTSIKRLDRIRTKHLSSFNKNKRDITSEGAYSQAEELMNDLTLGAEAMFRMELYFLLRGKSVEEVSSQVSGLQNFMASKGVKLYLEGNNLVKLKSGITKIFNELIPAVKPNFELRSHPNKTSHLRYLLPLRQSKLMDSGIEFLDHNDDPIFFDPFNKNIKNRNMLVTGLSGGGKSVFVNKLIHHLIDKHPTVILDKGGSFKRVTMYHEGIELKSGFNPMQFLDATYLREFVLSVVDLERFHKLERGKLLKEIKQYLEESTIKDFDSLLIYLEKEFEGISFYFEDIKEFFTGNNINEVPILYVDVENFPKNIISPLIIFLLQYFKTISEKEKILVFDECWSFLKDHAEFIDECFRTFRKTGAFPIAISQGLNDFKLLGRDLSTSITTNSYFKIFFPQELDVGQLVDEFDLENLGRLDFRKGLYSDCYLKSSDNKIRKIIRNALTPLELELFHTESGEDDLLNKFLAKNNDFFKTTKDAIDSFIGLKYAKNHSSFNDTNSFLWN